MLDFRLIDMWGGLSHVNVLFFTVSGVLVREQPKIKESMMHFFPHCSN